jgi:hypothetical protein
VSQTTKQGDANTVSRQSGMHEVQERTTTGWVGWISFAGVLMVLVGVFHIIDGLVALFEDDYFLVGRSGLVVNVDFTAWGWVHLIAGAVIVVAGCVVFTGKVWARAIGVLLAMASAIVNVGFLAAYPLWSATMITIDMLVIWALTVHGGEMRE